MKIDIKPITKNQVRFIVRSTFGEIVLHEIVDKHFLIRLQENMETQLTIIKEIMNKGE